MKTALISLSACAAILACAPMPTLDNYRPAVDPAKTNMAQFDADLADCVALAKKVQDDYQAAREQELAVNVLSGIVAGAIVGNAFGDGSHRDVAAGMAAGAVGGAASTDYTSDLIKFGPQRVVDRCMEGRGYNVLSDPGRGGG